jgi:hypothetical protein
MNKTYPAPCFDSFLSTYYVPCPREHEYGGKPHAYLAKIFLCNDFLNEMKKADRFDYTFFHNFRHAVGSFSNFVV